MLLHALFFLIITPAFSMDYIHEVGHHASSIITRFSSLFRGTVRHSKPRTPKHHKYDDDLFLQAAIGLSLDPSNNVVPDHLMDKTNFFEEQPQSPLDQVMLKGAFSNCELDYLWDLRPQNPIINFIGYMVLLNNRDRCRFDALTERVDREEWAHVFEVLNLGERTASHLFIIQSEMQDFIQKQSNRSYVLDELMEKMDHVSLELIFGKWGFSKRKTSLPIVKKLQERMEILGRRMGKKKASPGNLVSKISRYFEKELPHQTIPDSVLRYHRLFVFSYIANGYLRVFPHHERESKLNALTKRVSPLFVPEDLKGFSLDALIQDPELTLKHIHKASRITPRQQAAFNHFTAPLMSFVSKNALMGLRAFLSTFDISFLDIESEQKWLKLLQLALQDRTPGQINKIVTNLVREGFLPEDIQDIKHILIESAQYPLHPPYDRMYGKSIEMVSKAGKRGTEPKLWSYQKVLNQGLQLWLREYFDVLYKNGYVPKIAYMVEYGGYIQGELLERDSVITEEQYTIASDHMAHYVAANELKSYLFPSVAVGQKTILSLKDDEIITISLVNEDSGEVLETKELNPAYYDEQTEILIASIVAKKRDINVLPAAVKMQEIPSDIPLKPEYAIRGGPYITEEQKIKSRGRAIDALIRGGRIERSLKLPILLYLYGW